MEFIIREASPDDIGEAGRICYEAFQTLADHHRLTPDFPSAEVATSIIGMLIEHPGFYGIVAEANGRIVGSNFVDMRAPIVGLGPISVDPAAQNTGIGRRLMQHMIDYVATKKAAGLRLNQIAYHNRSLCLYTSVGFQTREPMSIMQGAPPGIILPGYTVRVADSADVAACNCLCRSVHGFERAEEVAEAAGNKAAVVVERLGMITGYSTLVGFFGHSVAKTNGDLIAIIGAAESYPGPGFILPTRNFEVLSWCLSHGLKLGVQATLMTTGLYSEPAGAYMPSVLY